MIILKIKIFAPLGMAIALVSCAAPKAKRVQETPVIKAQVKVPEPILAGPLLPILPDDGIRMPDMLDLPSDGDFRAVNPNRVKPGTDPGTVNSRPPTDPPSRLKPQQP